MSERSHHHNPAAHSRSRPTREKGAVPFQLIGHHQLRTPRFHSPPCLGNGGSWIAGSRRLPLFPRKEGQARAELPHREPLTMHANRPLKDIACVLHAQTKDATVVCVIGCQITRTRIHTLPKRLASARHSRVRKLYSYQIHSARFKQTSQWRRKSWWCILPAALILWYAGSDVMGCRRPTGGVFSYVSSDRVTLRAFPVATPRGRSSSSHEGEHLFCGNDLPHFVPVCSMNCKSTYWVRKLTWIIVWHSSVKLYILIVVGFQKALRHNCLANDFWQELWLWWYPNCHGLIDSEKDKRLFCLLYQKT